MDVQSNVTTRRTQVERRAEAEKALLNAAAELFAEHGVVQTSLAQIGERAGYSRGLANHHFGTKDALIDHLAQRCQGAFWDAVEQIDVDNGLEGVLAIADLYLKQVASPTPLGRAFLVMWGAALPAASRPAAAAIAEADERSRTNLVAWVETGQRDGSISTRATAETIALTLLGLLRGVAAQALIAPQAVDVEALRSQCQGIARAALGTAPRT